MCGCGHKPCLCDEESIKIVLCDDVSDGLMEHGGLLRVLQRFGVFDLLVAYAC